MKYEMIIFRPVSCKVEPRAPWRKKAYKIASGLNIEGGRIRSKVSIKVLVINATNLLKYFLGELWYNYYQCTPKGFRKLAMSHESQKHLQQ